MIKIVYIKSQDIQSLQIRGLYWFRARSDLAWFEIEAETKAETKENKEHVKTDLSVVDVFE